MHQQLNERETMKILLLEDDEIINDSVCSYFQMQGHVIDSFVNGEELLDNACANAYDIFLLDINTPGIDGFSVLKELRKETKNTPAVFITALSDIQNIEHGYNFGCNDYVKKPFHLRELELRINSLTKCDSSGYININKSYYFDKKNMRLLYNNKEVELSKNESLILNLLVNNINTTVDSDTIIEYVWDHKNICQNTLRTQMKKLRSKLNTDFIKNIRGRGYKIEKGT